MAFLFGDSTPSSLESNFIEFLREAMDFFVHSLGSDQRIAEERERAAELTRELETTVGRLERLHGRIATAAQALGGDTPDAAVESCGAALVRTSAEMVRAEIVRMRSLLAIEVAKLDAQAAHERAEIVKALGELMLRHELPETTLRTHLRAMSGSRYNARLMETTPFGLEMVMDLEVPPGHLFSSIVRVDKVMDRLELVGSQKDAKARSHPHRLERLFVTEYAIGVAGNAIKLREAADGASPGFDILLGADDQRVRLVRAGERDDGSFPSELAEGDAAKLRSLCERLAGPAAELNRHRRLLTEVMLDGQPLGELERPIVLVERLIQHFAPVVREIAARSASPDELVLRRMTGQDRREEIFVSRTDLRRKLEPLSASQRALFDPLGLGPGPVEPRLAGPPPAAKPAGVAGGEIEVEPATRTGSR